MRRILIALTMCFGLLVAGAPHASAPPSEPDLCPTDRPTLYDLTMTVKNVWALDDYTQHVQV
ncbi:MAG: hypothetical protein M3306_28835 [Actinomycetota bacterium]|nr:hypothetical protein [Actinomycetota bacterium]